MSTLPTGTVTFLFTDLERSTELIQHLGDSRYAQVLEEHQRLLRAAFQAGGGHEIDTQGDSFLIAFPRAIDAVTTAVQAQIALRSYRLPDGSVLRVRMGLHTGEPILAADRYVGLDVHRAARIGNAAQGGQILTSSTVYDLIGHSLPKEIALHDLGSHRLKDLHRAERIFQVLHPELPADFPPLRSLDAQVTNLPIQISSFVGRERELANAKHMLSGTRLLTLTGSGGCGKTRLALQVAAESLDDFPEGIWFVDLTRVADSTLVPQVIASAMNVSEQPNRTVLAGLVEYIGAKHLLLVLDNCEHLIDACARAVQSLLGSCPSLRMLTTSRELLGVGGETTFSVPPLSLPALHQHLSSDVVGKSDAVQLFVERAVAMRHDFVLTDRNVHSVVEVCRLLDGIPLAIELAAARTKVLSIDQIVMRLSDRFGLLTGGRRTAPPRHQTLRAVVDWSYDLLSEAERTLFRRLAIFQGGWALDAAESICVGEDLRAEDILDVFAHLVDKSLIAAEDRPDAMRYTFLETLRQYAREKLAESSEAERIATAHRDWFLALAEKGATALQTTEVGGWLDRLEADHHNLRAALEWSLTRETDAEITLRLATALYAFWIRRDYFSEGRTLLEAALAEGQTMAPRTLVAKALYAAGWLASRQHDRLSAVSYFDQARVLYQDLGDENGIAACLYSLGHQSVGRGDVALAKSYFQSSLETWQKVGDRHGIAAVLRGLGSVAVREGDVESARVLLEESLAIVRWLKLDGEVAWVLIELGGLRRFRGNYEQAAVLYGESLALFQERFDKRGIAWAKQNLGYVARHEGDYLQAARHFSESLLSFQQLGQPGGVGLCLAGLAGFALSRGMAEHAARLLGASEGLLGRIGYAIEPENRMEFDRDLAAVRLQLGEPVFAVKSAEGAAMTVSQAVEYALALRAAERSRVHLSEKH